MIVVRSEGLQGVKGLGTILAQGEPGQVAARAMRHLQPRETAGF